MHSKFNRILAILFVITTLVTPCTFSASAASGKSAACAMVCTGSGYKASNRTRMYGQTCVEKYVTVAKNKTLSIKPYIISGTAKSCKNFVQYMRFTVWVYDINTNKRVLNTVCSSSSTVYLKNKGKKTAHYSIQVRPYVETSAWKKYSNNSINANIKSIQYEFKWNNKA